MSSSLEQPKVRTVKKTLSAKAVRFRTTKKGWSPRFLADMLAEICKKAPTAGDRHHPKIVSGKPLDVGTSCAFINRNLLVQDVFVFHMWAYSCGQAPESMEADLSKNEVTSTPLALGDGASQREVVYACRCVTYGDVLLIENARGTGGGATLAKLLNSLLRRYIDPKHPAVHLEDFASMDFADLVQQKGGITRVRARLLHTVPAEGSRYAKTLQIARNEIPGAKGASIIWESEAGGISADDAKAVLDEFDNDSLDGAIVYFQDGSSISNLNVYREKHQVELPVANSGQPHSADIENALLDYLTALRDTSKGGPINDKGQLVAVKYIEEGDKK